METYQGTPCGECGEPVTQYGTDPGPLDLECPNGHTLFVPACAQARSRIAALRAIVNGHSAARVEGYLVDAFTASMLVQVFEALSPASREKFGTPSLPRLVEFGWEHVS